MLERTPFDPAELLTRFARLAARVAGASCGLVVTEAFGVGSHGLDGRADLAGWLLTTTGQVDESTDGPAFTTIDLAESRWAGQALTSGPLGLRFLARRTLLSDGGRPVGFLGVADPAMRPGLRPEEESALADVAVLLQRALAQTERHTRLMEVTQRAARMDRMLREVSEAASCEDALARMLGELCEYHGAAVGRIWRLAPDELMHEVSRYGDDRVEKRWYYRMAPTAPVRLGNSQTAQSIAENRPQALIYSKIENKGRFVLLEAAISAGLLCQVSYPIWVQDQRFGVALAFTTEREDLQEIVADVGSLANTIRPALFRKVTEEQIRFMAHHDDLTQLSNRAVFTEKLAAAVAAARSGGGGLALLYLDLDGFKLVNDSRGHAVGDRLLATVAVRMQTLVPACDTIARIGGDEFAIVHRVAGAPGSPGAPATELARQLVAALGRPFDVDGQKLLIGVSIGIAQYPEDGQTPDVLQRNADAALYEAKQGGRNTFRLFEAPWGEVQQERQLIERDLKLAIEQEALTLAFQPIVESEGLAVCGLEALLRWTHPVRGPLSPARFVPMAEAAGLILPLGRWVLHAACDAAVRWPSSVGLSVNLSPLQFRQAGLAREIEAVLGLAGLEPSRLDLEVTEGLLLDDSGRVMQTMHELREMGVGITLDDFGTAYASLSYLRRFSFDRLKIDKSFIQGIVADDATRAIVQAVLSLSARLKLQVVAEGVETEEELSELRAMGCELVQGFLTGRPMPGDQAAALVSGVDVPVRIEADAGPSLGRRSRRRG